MTRTLPITAVILLTLGACTTAESEPLTVKPAVLPASTCPQTQVFGSMKQMHDGDVSRQVALSDLSWSPNAIALGASDGKTMELTAVDGTLWLVGPGQAGAPNVVNSAEAQGATFAVYAEPSAWTDPLDIDATSPEQILDRVAQAARSSSCAQANIVPFRVRGHARTLTWSTVGQPTGLTVENADEDVIIVGFWAPTQKGVFVPPSLDGHLHVVLPSKRHAGHLRAIELTPGATLELPQG